MVVDTITSVKEKIVTTKRRKNQGRRTIQKNDGSRRVPENKRKV